MVSAHPDTSEIRPSRCSILESSETCCRKRSWRMSETQKAGQRERLRRVDDVIAAVAESGVEIRALTEAKALPKEHEMVPKGECPRPTGVMSLH